MKQDSQFPASPVAAFQARRRQVLLGGVGGLALALVGNAFAARQVADKAPDFLAHGILIPGLVDSDSSGLFVELWQAIDAGYREGSIQFQALPVARVYEGVPKSHADFGFPVMKLREGADAGLPYRFSTETLGKVSFVLYSNKAKPLTPADVQAAAKAGKPYRIEAPPFDWGVPIQQFTDFESALRKVEAGRLDALLWAQEDVDMVLRRLALKNIHRALYENYDDIFIVPRTPRGDFVDATLTRVIREMRANGSLAKAYAKVHRPYDNWQP